MQVKVEHLISLYESRVEFWIEWIQKMRLANYCWQLAFLEIILLCFIFHKKRPEVNHYFRSFLLRISFLLLFLFSYTEQLHLKNQSSVGSNIGLRTSLTVGQIAWNPKTVFAPYAHQLYSFSPTGDHLIEAK